MTEFSSSLPVDSIFNIEIQGLSLVICFALRCDGGIYYRMNIVTYLQFNFQHLNNNEWVLKIIKF